MSDAREKQPLNRHVGLCDKTKGNTTYCAKIETWTYHSIKNEDVFSRDLDLTFKANDIEQALGFASSIAAIIGLMHDVHQCHIRFVGERGAI